MDRYTERLEKAAADVIAAFRLYVAERHGAIGDGHAAENLRAEIDYLEAILPLKRERS